MADLTFYDVSHLIRLESQSGKLYWLPRPLDMFAAGKLGVAAYAKSWNNKFAGKEAFTSISGSGYRNGRIFRRGYLAHRVVWLLHTGAWPSDQIDHINGDRTDNRISNLREATNGENARNQKLKATNKSGACGVRWKAQEGKWEARIKISGREVSLGRFDDISLAIAARAKAESKYGFSARHGRAAA